MLAKYRNPLLSLLTTNEFTVTNYFDFPEKLSITIITFIWVALMLSCYLPRSLWKKLFTILSTINSSTALIVVNELEKTYLIYSNITTETSFILDKKVSKQIDEVEMGWPVFPTLANSFLCHYQQFWLYECLHQFKLVVYIHYVDDIFVLFKYKEHKI